MARSAEKLAEQICEAIHSTTKLRPNDLFRVECVAMGRLVAKGEIDERIAVEAMMKRFVLNVTAAAKVARKSRTAVARRPKEQM